LVQNQDPGKTHKGKTSERVREGRILLFRAQERIYFTTIIFNNKKYRLILFSMPTHSLEMRAKQLLDLCVEKYVQGTTVTTFNVV
jgi:hypothetical protein